MAFNKTKMASGADLSKALETCVLATFFFTSIAIANGETYTYMNSDGDILNATTIAPESSVEDELLDIISEQTLRLIETVINAFILPVLVLCGVTGNVINIAVFLKQGLGDRINVCLFSLSISDTGFDLFHLASRTFVIFNLFDKELGAAWQARAFFLTGAYLGFLLTTNTLTLLISLQRCIIVVSPLSAKRLPSAKQTAMVIAVLVVVCFFGVGFYSFRWVPGTCTHHLTNATYDCIQLSDFSVKNQAMFNALTEITFMTVIPLVTLVGVVATSFIIAVRMRSILAWRKDTAHAGASAEQASAHATTANHRENAMTKMLLVVAAVYCVCTIPAATQTVVRLLVPEFVASGQYNNAFYAALCISHLLESVNCSANFVIYYTMSTKFKATLKALFRIREKKQEKEDQQEPQTRTSIVSALEL